MQKYTCPMHPEVITDHPGNCPKCGMKLVPVKEKKRRTSNAVKARGATALYALNVQRPTVRRSISDTNASRDATHGTSTSTKKCRWKCTPPSISLIR